MGNFSNSILVHYLREFGLPLQERDVAEFEGKIGQRLPADYRSFLMEYNGGRCSLHDQDDVGFPLFETAYCDVLQGFRFFGLNYPEPARYYTLPVQYDEHVGRLPAGAVPIADFCKVDLILIDYANNGSIVVWEREKELEKLPEENRLFVADSFSNFVQGVIHERIEYPTKTEKPFSFIEAHHDNELRAWLEDNHLDQIDPWTQHEIMRFTCSHHDLLGAALLLARGFPANGTGDPDMDTPIELAARDHEADLVILLLEFGADEKDLYKNNQRPIELVEEFIKEWKTGLRSVRRRFGI